MIVCWCSEIVGCRFAIELDQRCIKPQLCRAEAHQFIYDLKWLLLGKAIEQPDEGTPVAKAEPVVQAPALADLNQVFVLEGGDALELLLGEHLLA